jgi:streptomycin 6-kinase
VAQATGLELRRFLQWIIACGGRSAASLLEDGETPDVPLQVAQNALAQLAKF